MSYCDEIQYSYKNKFFNTEHEVLQYWLSLEDECKKYYDIFKYRNKNVVSSFSPKIINKSDLQQIRNHYNSCEVHYKNSNRIYNYKDMNKINYKDLHYVVLMNLRGINGNVAGAIRIEYINGELIKIS